MTCGNRGRCSYGERRVGWRYWFLHSGIMGRASRRMCACVSETRVRLIFFLCPLCTPHWPLLTSSKHSPPGSRASPSPPPHSLMHLFMSGFRASKYPGGQDGRQTPTWRMSFLSSRMNSLGEHLRQPLTSEQSSQPLAQAWLPSALTAG